MKKNKVLRLEVPRQKAWFQNTEEDVYGYRCGSLLTFFNIY